jgi:hypothetical protein
LDNEDGNGDEVEASLNFFMEKHEGIKKLHAMVAPQAGAADRNFDTDQIGMIYETLLLRLFRLYENSVERLFISLTLHMDDYESGDSGLQMIRYILPVDGQHARRILSGGKQGADGDLRLDWAKCSAVIEQAKVYFGEENILLAAYGDTSRVIEYARVARNHVAHNSAESKKSFYKKMLVPLFPTQADEYSDLPVGAILQQRPRSGPAKRKEVFSYLDEGINQFFVSVRQAVDGMERRTLEDK